MKCLIINVAQMVKQACNIDYGRGAGLVQHYDKQKKNFFAVCPTYCGHSAMNLFYVIYQTFSERKLEMYCRTRPDLLDKQGKNVTVFPITDSTYFITRRTVIRPLPFNIISCTSFNCRVHYTRN